MGLSHSSIYRSSHVRSVTTSGPVIVEPFSEIYPRLDVYDFYGNEKYEPQISGIHGLPFTAYDGVTGDAQEYHNDTDCATGRFVEEAKKIALQYPDNEKEKYVEAAKQLRHPFWDWADVKAIKGVPKIFTSPEIEINTPNGKKNVNNPLKSFTLPVDTSYPLAKGQNPTDKPNYNVPNIIYNPYTPAGYPTVRHPNSNYEDQTDLLNSNMSAYVPTVFRPGVYQMFHISDFLRFSSHSTNPDGTQAGNLFSGHPAPSNPAGCAHFASIETNHDDFHLVFGGPGGHMALWQGIYPNSWVPKTIELNGSFTDELYKAIDENTDLTLFRKTKTEFWKSSDVLDIEKLGYTCLEVEKFKSQDPKKLKLYVLELYKPDPIKAGKLDGPYSIRVFIDLPDANAQTPVASPHFAGLVSMLSSTKNHVHDNTFVYGTVDITAAMERLNIRTQVHDPLYEVNTTTGLLSTVWIFDVEKEINIVPVSLNGKGVSPKEAGVDKIEVFTFEHDKVDPNFLDETSGKYYGSKNF
ncbi:Tyrosinase [Gigaspora margarita]|uniref:Tyrosinase n=1 Tax=Gigaspora margarita TaxID=4874 RepID=A0A8H4ET05_GIGMA|nr:Tyrosinase [Gigaspora margarita]